MSNNFILIVDDEDDIRSSLSRTLKKWAKQNNLLIETIDSGRAALDFLAGHHDRTAVILSDQRMSGLSGSEFLIEASSLYPQIVSVILTGHASTSDIASFIQAGIFAFLEKPWDKDNLISTMDGAYTKYLSNIEEISREKNLADEINLASDFAVSHMKPDIPESDLLDFSYSSVAANSLPFSGDYLEVIEIKDGRFIILLGDVTGHGLKASFVIAILKSIIHSDFITKISNDANFSPSEYISLLNKIICKKLTDFPDTFLALSTCLLNERTGELIFSNAGQPPLMILTDSGVVEVSNKNMVLGVDPEASYRQDSYRLSDGDVMFFCTDGLYPTGKNITHIDKVMLHELLMEKRSSNNFTDSIIDSVRKTEKNHFSDDITTLSIGYRTR